MRKSSPPESCQKSNKKTYSSYGDSKNSWRFEEKSAKVCLSNELLMHTALGFPGKGPTSAGNLLAKSQWLHPSVRSPLFFGATVLGKISCTSVHTKIDQIAGWHWNTYMSSQKKILGFDWICFTANKTESLKNQMPEKSIPLAVNVDFPFVERQCHTNMMILITRKYSKGREKKNQKRILSISSLRDKVISPYFHRFFHVNHPF